MTATDVQFAAPPPPVRGGRPLLDDWEARVAEAATGQPGIHAVLGTYETQLGAETVRRRINRGSGAWRGGRVAWSVAVRKLSGGDEWRVYVAFRSGVRLGGTP